MNDVLHYPRGSQDIGIEKQSYTKVIATQSQENLLTDQKEGGATVTYNPARLYGGERIPRTGGGKFAVGDRLGLRAVQRVRRC